MKFKGAYLFSFLVVLLVAGAAFLPYPPKADKESVLIQTILAGVNQLHYSPKEIDDGFSEKVYDLYLDRLDGGRRWLTQADTEQLKPFRHRLDDEALAGTYAFFDKSVELVEASLVKTQKYYRDILAQPFDFSSKEDIELDGDKKPFAKNDAELKEYWRKSMKYETLVRLNNKMKEQDKLEEGEEKKSVDVLEKEAREAVLEVFDDFYERMQKRRRTDWMSDYLNAVTNVFDPHTGYFEPKDKANFDISMSGSLEGIGARLQTDGDYTKVSSIVVGGPAWKDKELEENDLIMKVTQEGEEAGVDVTGFHIDEVVKIIRGKKGTKVTLTVKKVDGNIKDVTIERDVVILEEGFAKSVILDYPGTAEHIGYIKLPRFYADFNGTTGRSCAKDVAKEIKKLKEKNVKGIILDLRNNGGGSLRDVVKMSGLFIEKGPIVQVKARTSQPEVLQDRDQRVQYDGPLVVMVNQFSASASEILAAALQDYGRAVIVGSNSTFGKGTVQRFFDLDQAIRGNSDIKPLGEVKMTIQKFYRINGGSTQLKGVTPDIILPDRYYLITELGERDNEFPMEWTSINPVQYTQDVYKIKNLDQLKARSKARVSDNETFQLIMESAKFLKDQRDRTSYSMNMETYQATRKSLEERSEKYNDMLQPIEGLKVNNLEVDLPGIEVDESKKARNEDWVKSISKDVYITETMAIMSDMIGTRVAASSLPKEK